MAPKAGLSEHLRGSSALLSAKTPKKTQKQTPKHGQTMMLIGGLGGHGSSGESHWVEGGQRGDA